METAPTLCPPLRQSATDPGAAIDAYFETLRAEQAQFLDALGRARSLLGPGAGRMAEVTAIQHKLTRQFLDAQRSIMKRRAEIDAANASFAEDVVALDGALAQRQLADLLDGWWRATNQHGRLAVTDGGAAAGDLGDQAPAGSTVSRLVSKFDAADPADLVTILTDLAATLELPPPPPTATEQIRIEPTVAPEETFRKFWNARSAGTIQRVESSAIGTSRPLRSLATHVLLPMTLVTSALVLLMAWIG